MESQTEIEATLEDILGSEDLLLHIFTFLDGRDLLSARLTCTAWWEVTKATVSTDLWRTMHFRHPGSFAGLSRTDSLAWFCSTWGHCATHYWFVPETNGGEESFVTLCSSLPNLQWLHVERVGLEHFARGMAALEGLVHLDFSKSGLEDFPSSDVCPSLATLESLNLASNSLESTSSLTIQAQKGDIGERIGSLGLLTRLRELTLRQNSLTELPAVASLRHLCHLNISDNQLSELSEDIGLLTSLRTLSVIANRLKQLPSSIGNLQNLEVLDVGYNVIVGIPSTMGHLCKLVSLYLHHNKIRTLSFPLRDLSSLRHLYLSGNQLTSIPDDIGELNELITLKLENNPGLCCMPEGFARLASLQVLMLPTNRGLMDSLPEEVMRWECMWAMTRKRRVPAKASASRGGAKKRRPRTEPIQF